MTKWILLGLLLVQLPLYGATIAVIDSGVDVEHKDFTNNIWINPNEVADDYRDNDGNDYPDDVYGWNFAESNNLVIDRSYLGTFSTDPYKFFELQGKSFMGTITEEEKQWITDKKEDPGFLKEMQKFGNFIHGTHVAGITIKNSSSKILSVKLIPTEVKLIARNFIKKNGMYVFGQNDSWRMKQLKKLLSALASQQMTMLSEVARYVNGHKADIANGSFGTGFEQAKMITDNLYRVIFFKKPSEEDSNKVALHFLNELIIHGKNMVESAPHTLFVFAAGNSGSDNDKYPTSPTNVKADNVISVAATYQNKYLAPFSCYGKTTVDVAAPGMLINSQIPGDEYLKVSGTSQAAPYVAGIAAKVKEENKALGPKEIKEIILGTVDKKNYLNDKVSTAGLVNSDRAIYAAKASLRMTVAEAIAEAKINIQDWNKNLNTFNGNPHTIQPIQLPSLFR